MDATTVGEILTGSAAWAASLASLAPYVSRQLRRCRAENADLRDRISALETEAVALRKLMPPGEWWAKMEADRSP